MKNFLSNTLFLALFLAASLSLSAQIQHGGKPYSFRHSANLGQIPVANMAFVDVDQLMAEDELETSKGDALRFGTDLDVYLSLGNAGKWEFINKKDRVWRLQIHSDQAHSLNLIFDQFFLPEGAKLFLYTPDHEHVLGAFTHENNKSHGKFSTTVLPGADMILEYYEPYEVRNQGVIEIGKVIHGYRNAFFSREKGFGDSGSCNNNVNCPVGLGWENEINASLMYLLSNNTRICSGAMLNNTAQDSTPYFLSANHCYSSDFSTWIFMFNYQSPGCANVDGPTNQTVSGSTLRARRSESDFALFELSSLPPAGYNVYLAGWNKTNIPATAATAIHHPNNDIKKISFENDPLDSTAWGGGADDHWEVNDWDDGTTEPGSSGSPLFDQDHRVIGQLHGGGAACGNNDSDEYGRLDVSWNGSSASERLHDWLDPQGTGSSTLDGMYIYTPAVALDVSASFLSGIEEFGCDAVLDPEITFNNLGATPVTSLTIRHGIVGSPLTTTNWTGNIAFPSAGTMSLPAPTPLPGVGMHEFIAILESPNGGTDLNAINDTIKFPFEVINGQIVEVELMTDDFPEETSIEIREQLSNNLVYMDSDFDANTLVNLTYCLDTGCYIFRITDSYGDGICCSYGNGYYEFYLPNGTLGTSGGQFAFTDSYQFCVTDTNTTATAGPLSASIIKVYPNPARDQFTVKLDGYRSGESVHLYALDALGRQVGNWNLAEPSQTFRIQDWPAGIYQLRAQRGTQTSHFKLIVQ